MSANAEMERIATFPVLDAPEAREATGEPRQAPAEEPVLATAKVRRARPSWFASAVLGAAAVIATGTLGYVSNAAAQQRNQAYDAFVTTKVSLVATGNTLAQAQADAATRKVTADYAAFYVADEGKVQLDYQNIQACSSYGTCRTAGQDLLSDLQKFQSDRGKAVVPASLSTADAGLGDALSAAIAADQEFIDGMDTFSVNKVKDGLHKLDAAMLNMAKAQVAVGNGLQ